MMDSVAMTADERRAALDSFYEALDSFTDRPGLCRADLNGDGLLDSLDLMRFQETFESSRRRRVDFNDDDEVNELDRAVYLELFRRGCP